MFIYVLAKIQVLSLVNVVCNIFQSYTFLLTPDENVKKQSLVMFSGWSKWSIVNKGAKRVAMKFRR